MNISIIIPTLDESVNISRLITRLLTADNQKIEIIVVDGGSTDNTIEVAKNLGAKVLHCDCSRAKQMNIGAKAAIHEILYFVHADTLPPLGYYEDGLTYLEKGFDAVCYKSKFENKRFLMHLNEFFSQFYWLASRGGDQSLFIKKDTFYDLGLYDESLVVMEEYPIIGQLMRIKKLGVIPKPILIGTRKYDNRSWFTVSRANYVAFKMYKKGIASSKIKARYLEILG